jgi:hypothetical protein
MDPIELPANIDELSDDDLGALDGQITEAATSLSEDMSPEAADELVRLADVRDVIVGHRVARAEAAAALEAKRTEALARLQPAAAAVETEVELAVEPVIAAPEVIVPDLVTPAPVVAPAALAVRPVVRPAPSALRTTAPAPSAPVATGNSSDLQFVASAFARGAQAGTVLDIEGIAKSICDVRNHFGTIPSGVSENITIASMNLPFEHVLGQDAGFNMTALDRLKGDSLEALVASGGTCVPFSPLYTFFRTAQVQTPVEDALPVTGAERGGMRWIQPLDYRDAVRAVGKRTAAQNTKGNLKTVARVVCPTVTELAVMAVTQITEFDNLMYRVFPELVAAFLADAAVMYAETKETLYLDRIDAASTPTTSTPAYGASRGLLYDWTRSAVAYRKRHGMRRDAQMILMAPDWSIDLIKMDMVNDLHLGTQWFNISDAQVRSFVSNLNLTVIWYAHSSTGLKQGWIGTQMSGQVLEDFPDKVVSYLYAPGTFVRLNGGQLDLGIVRDSVLNSTNDLQIFFEEWLELAMVGNESIKITSTVCPTGTGPSPVTALVCQTGS